MKFDLVVKGGTVVTAEASYPADVGIIGERIAAVGESLEGDRNIDARGKLVTPGAVDIHVHMQMPLTEGVVSADDFFSGTRAAAHGGTTTIVDFVAPLPGQGLVDAIVDRRAEADPCVAIDYSLHMTIGPSEIDKLDQLPEAFAAGCTSFKMYMAYGFRLNDGQLLRALEAVRDCGGVPVVHAENWDVICALIDRNVAAGRTTPPWHPRSRPPALEAEAVGRVIDIAAFVGTPVHIFHVSCEAAVERIAWARAGGLRVTGETCPQYLFLTQEAYDAPGVEGALPVCAPPLRTERDQNALWTALAKGDLQLVTTDHCPFTRADKARGAEDFSKIPGGVPSIEMRFPAIYSAGVRGGLLTVNQWVDLCCTTPAQLVGLTSKGQIAVGFDADMVVFDPAAHKVLSLDALHEKVDWTPYTGMEIHGWPSATIRRGDVIVEADSFKAEPGSGRFILRTGA